MKSTGKSWGEISSFFYARLKHLIEIWYNTLKYIEQIGVVGMEIFQTIRVILGFSLFIALGINLFYRGIQAMRKIHQSNYAKETIHAFKCRNCEDTYQLNGEEAKSRISIWATRLEKRTPKSQTTAIRFECPACDKKAFQDQIFNTDVTALAGNVRAQLTSTSKDILIDLLVKGVLPILIAMPILGIIFP